MNSQAFLEFAGEFLFDPRLGESRDVAAEHADVVERLQTYAETVRADLGDRLTGRRGSGVRESGRWNPPVPAELLPKKEPAAPAGAAGM